MSASPFNVGAFIQGPPTSPRVLVRHADLLSAYADGVILEKGDEREAYLSHFTFGPEMQEHFKANRQSVAQFAGPCWCRWLVFDIDRLDLAEALDSARILSKTIQHRYPEMESRLPVYFSGGKGFHILVELSHNPPPSVGFNHVAKTFAEALAAFAGVKIDGAIYDLNRIVRLPNTKHPKTGLFKRRIESEDLFQLDIDRIRELAAHPAGDGIPTLGAAVPQMEIDWQEAQQKTVQKTQDRAAIRRDFATTLAEPRAPRSFLDLVRFGVDEGQRHQALFTAAAWLTEQGSPPSLAFALLTEPGRDLGLAPKDVERQIQCGIDHANKQKSPHKDEGGKP